MADIPRTVVVPVPELGDDVTLTLRNPWFLPEPPRTPTNLLQRPGLSDAQGEARAEALGEWIEDRMREQFAAIVVAWHGVTDIEGNPLPLPSEDPTVYDRAPRAVKAWVSEAVRACEQNMTWDPTRRLREAQEAREKTKAS